MDCSKEGDGTIRIDDARSLFDETFRKRCKTEVLKA